MNKNHEQRKQAKQELTKIIGINLRIARELNGFTRKQVMQQVFGGDGRNLNRISEIEHGNLLPPLVTLHKLAQMYNVSLDFIFGRTNEPDVLAEDAYVGRAVSTIRHLGIDMMDGITKVLIEQAKALPKADCVALMECSKNLIQDAIRSQSRSFDNDNQLKLRLNQLNQALIQAERGFAKRQLLCNIAFDDAISHHQDRQHKNRLSIEKRDQAILDKQVVLPKQSFQLDLF